MIDLHAIVKDCAELYNVKPEKVFTRSRKKGVVSARQLTIFILRGNGVGVYEIGKLLRNEKAMHYSIVSYVVKKVSKLLEDEEFRKDALPIIKKHGGREKITLKTWNKAK